jgi:hypothetical protein
MNALALERGTDFTAANSRPTVISRPHITKLTSVMRVSPPPLNFYRFANVCNGSKADTRPEEFFSERKPDGREIAKPNVRPILAIAV